MTPKTTATKTTRRRPGMTAEDVTAASQRYPLLGYVVSWHARGVQIDYDDLENLLTLGGFHAALPSRPTRRNALRRGIESWLKARGAVRGDVGGDDEERRSERDAEDETAGARAGRAGIQERTLVRVSSPVTSDYVAFAVVSEQVDMASLGFSHDTSLRFLLHKKSGMVIATTDRRGVDVTQSDRVLAEIQPHWDAAKNLIVGKDISRMLVEIIEGMGPVHMGVKGGVYFVLAEHRDALQRLSTLVAALPTTFKHRPFLTMVGVPDEEATRRQLSKATQVTLEADLRELEVDLQRFVAAKPGTVKSETIAARLIDYQALKDRAIAYRDLLGLWTGDIEQAVDRLRAAAAAVLTSDALTDVEPPAAAHDGAADPPPTLAA